jgi:spectinomycin phosphotransferase
MLAPKERDLAMIGGSAVWNDAHEAALFYQGYGQARVDRMALAYYRYERIVHDIAAFCQQLLLSSGGGIDREQSYTYFASQFLPGHEVELACKTEAFFT